jgi:hypothetical protein
LPGRFLFRIDRFAKRNEVLQPIKSIKNHPPDDGWLIVLDPFVVLYLFPINNEFI